MELQINNEILIIKTAYNSLQMTFVDVGYLSFSTPEPCVTRMNREFEEFFYFESIVSKLLKQMNIREKFKDL